MKNLGGIQQTFVGVLALQHIINFVGEVYWKLETLHSYVYN